MELILFYKPFQVLSQFSPEGDKRTLADFIPIPNVYPAGRLDYDSEGLLLLTANGKLQHRISDPRHKWSKTYWVQVEGNPSSGQLEQLRSGVLLKDGMTLPSQAHLVEGEPDLPARVPPIRFRKSVPDRWISLTIREGRNRQVRRMTAAVGLPTLRLVRVQVGPFDLGGLQPGEWKRVDARALLKEELR